MSFRLHLLALSALAAIASFATPANAQPPSPLELVRGLRENGQVDLALEYLKSLEGKPLSADDKAAMLLERAKCLLDAADDEPDEGTRLGMIVEAKEGLNAFTLGFPNHPRAVEGLLTSAKLTSIDAKEQLARAKKMDIPPPSTKDDEKRAREVAQQAQYKEAEKARPRFQSASTQFAKASGILRTKLEDKTLDPITRRNLEREAFEAELASGINQFSIAETFVPDEILTGEQKQLRNKFLEQAKEIFGKLGKGSQTNRTVWIARAWYAEVTYEQDQLNDATAEVNAILNARLLEAEDGKRMAKFFQLRRNVKAALNSGVNANINQSIIQMRAWLTQYGNNRKPTPEVFTIRYYLARTLHYQADVSTFSKDPNKPLPLSDAMRKQLEEAERMYRALSQSDHEYTSRASRYRIAAVRKLLGDADKDPLLYNTFEKAQMASIIQLSKLVTAEGKEEKILASGKPDEKQLEAARAEVATARRNVISLLERARELATPNDSPADVTDVLLRLIYFYQANDQHQQAAVLGDHVARTIKATGGKAAIAGLLGFTAYMNASVRLKIEDREALTAARLADRARAISLAQFLDEKYPNDNATDSARHRLASLYVEDKKLMEAYEVLIRIRSSYTQITNARLLQGYVVSQLVLQRDQDLPPEKVLPAEKKKELFRRVITDLAKVPKPGSAASEDDVRGYISARVRFASLLFAQGRVDPDAERANPGYNQAFSVAEELTAIIPTFDCLTEMKDGMKKLNLDGMEMNYLVQDTYIRSIYLRARGLIDVNKLDEAGKLIQPTLDNVNAGGTLVTPELRDWAAAAAGGDEVAKQKGKIATLAGAVDKTRVDVILAGFRLKVKQGKAAEANTMLDLIAKAGGSIEESLPLLEPVGRELAALVSIARKENREADVKNLNEGLGVLLDKIRTVKTLPVQSLLFIGQTLQSVGKNNEAIETLKKIPVPAYKDWETKKPEEIPQEERGKVLNMIRDYSIAQLSISRAYRELKNYAEAEKMLRAIIGTNEKPGWGSGRLYFRKELATLYEAKGAAETDVKKANAEWGAALREWTTLFNIQRNRISNTKDPTPDQLAQLRNEFADAFFEVQRCLVAANQQLLKAQPPDKLQKTYDDVGKRFVDMEKQIPAADFKAEVQTRYSDLLKATPPLMNSYKAAGGKLFLGTPAPPPK